MKKDMISISKFFVSFILIFYFIYQHVMGLFWDFAAYKLNALYFLGKGDYFEFLRPPFVPILLAFFNKLFSFFDEYLYIIFVSLFFIFSCFSFISNVYFFIHGKKNSKKIKIWQFLLLFSFITPYFLLNSFTAGSELLSLSLLIFLISQILRENICAKNSNIFTFSGVIFGLLFLTRYSNLYFGIFLLFAPRVKIILKRLVHFVIIILPWFIYNFVKTGNFLTSMVNGYAQNILFRQGLNRIIPLEQYSIFLNFIFLFFILGFFYFVYIMIKTKNKKMLYIFLIIFFITFMTIRDFSKIPLRSLRYLFNVNLIIAFFSSFFLFKLFYLKKNIWFKRIFFLIIFIIIIFSFYQTILIENPLVSYYNKNRYVNATDTLKELNLTQCSVRSPDWVLLNYYGVRSKNSYDESFVDRHMEQNEIVVLFKPIGHMQEYVNDLPVIVNNSNILILGEIPLEKYDCKSPYGLDETYLNYYRRFSLEERGIVVNTEVCHVLFSKYKFLEHFCLKFTNY